MDKGLEFEFCFSPLNGITFIQTLNNTKSLRNQTDVTESKTGVSIQKTPSGYTYTATPLSIVKTRNGTKIDDPILSIIKDITITYDLDHTGQIVKIFGFEKLVEIMQERAKTNPILASPTIASALTEEAMARKERGEWDARIGSFVGRKAKLGDVWTSFDRFVLPNGQMALFDVGIKFVGYTRYDVLDCLQLQFAYNTDADQLRDLLEKTWDEMFRLFDTAQTIPITSGFEIVGGGKRLVDPNTMLIFAETMVRRVKYALTVPGKGTIPIVMQENKEYLFDYPASAMDALVKRLPSGS